ncbi:MAG TPA: hypothetical protein VN682_17795 [Terriglobales bacterium]|nr:hypothetical protein [Terriglobales bacterium]HXF14779.1 hypothetical protein [Terriglobales bacterium]
MQTSIRKSQTCEIYERLGELIDRPESFGLSRPLPARVLAILTQTRELHMQQMNAPTVMQVSDGDLASELSQDSDAKRNFPKDEEAMKAFNRLLSRRMEQLHLSTNDVAVSLHTSIKDVWDLRRGVLLPTEQRIAELALLLDVGHDDLRTAVQEQVNGERDA